MKKIALDLDGVVFDSENLYRVLTEIYDVNNNKKDTIMDNSERTFQKRYDWKENEFKEFYKNNFEFVLENASIMTGADIVLKKLKSDFQFLIVTARTDYEVEIAKSKLLNLGFDNITIFNNEKNKIEKLLEQKVDYIIDDDFDICINAARNDICALYFKNNAAKQIQNEEKVVNVNNWGEIYKYLMLSNDLV